MPRGTLVLVLAGVLAGLSPGVEVRDEMPPIRPGVPRIMPLGDSITFGDGSSHGLGYRGDLARLLAGAGRDVDFVGSQGGHEGHPAWEIGDIADQVERWLRRWQPTVVLLHVGTNDLNRNVPDAPTRLGALLDLILRTAPRVTVLVAALAPVRPDDVRARVDAFNAELPGLVAARAAAGHDVRLVDIAAALTEADLADDLHPNDRGYARMAGAWFTALVP